MICIPILNPKIELSAFSRSAEQVFPLKGPLNSPPPRGGGNGLGGGEALRVLPTTQSTSTGSALRENADNLILGFKTSIKVIYFFTF